MFAVEEDHPECMNELIKAGADVNAVHNGYTPLILAARKGMTRYAGLLIEAGGHVNMKDSVRDALYYSAENKDDRFMEILLKAGADVNSGRGKGLPPPLLTTLQSPLIPHNKKCPKPIKCVNMLIKAGADVNAESMYGQTALMSAAQEDNRNCIRILIKAGAHVNAETTRGETALMSAAMFGSVKCTKTLLKAGADVNAGQNNEGTALMKASRYNKYKCLDVLLAAGADVNSTDRKGRDAHHLLLLNFYIHEAYLLKCTKRLLRAGIHINRFNTPQAKNALGIVLESKTWVVNRDVEIYRDLLMLLYAAGETLDGTEEEKYRKS